MKIRRPTGRRHLAVLLGALAALAGCAPIPEYQRPAELIPSSWPATAPAPDGIDARAVSWRELFRDPRLQELISLAMENNRDLKMALTRMLDARAQFDVANADRLPTFNLSTGQSVAKYPGELSGSGHPVISRQASVSLAAVSYEIDFWGRVSAATEAARARLLASEESRRALNISMIAEVANLYFSLLEFEERIAVSRAIIESRERSMSITQRGSDQGAAAKSDVLLTEALLNTARAELAILENQRASAEHAMKVLVGRDIGNLPKGRRLLDQEVRADLAPGIPADVILTRPDVLAAEQRLIEARANIEAARAAFLPRVLLTASLGLMSKSLATLFEPGTGNWTYQPNISMPLFDNGRTAGYYEMSMARREGAVADYEKSIQLAFREVSDLLAARNSLSHQYRAAEGASMAQEQRLIVAEARFRAGAISYLEVLDARREALSAKQTLIQVRRAQLTTTAQLYKALGGGRLTEEKSGNG